MRVDCRDCKHYVASHNACKLFQVRLESQASTDECTGKSVQEG